MKQKGRFHFTDSFKSNEKGNQLLKGSKDEIGQNDQVQSAVSFEGEEMENSFQVGLTCYSQRRLNICSRSLLEYGFECESKNLKKRITEHNICPQQSHEFARHKSWVALITPLQCTACYNVCSRDRKGISKMRSAYNTKEGSLKKRVFSHGHCPK